jgi:FAD/FMN-containing dehydrogenase
MQLTSVTRLAAEISGPLITPGDVEYETARRVWNGMIDKRPAAIARCASADDVATAIGFAAAEQLPVAVRGGSHNIAGNATCDDGLVIDLAGLKRIEVDREARRGRAGGGVNWGELDAVTQGYGLATTGGLMPSTGIAGFTLGGGLGHLMRSYGLACDNLVSAEVVTADGSHLSADAEHHPDLFWALRGGAATSASSRSSNSSSTTSDPSSWQGDSSIHWFTPGTRCASTATSAPTRRTS